MGKNRIILYLEENLAQALLTMSRTDCRTPTQETIWILQEEAKRRGLLPIQNVQTQHNHQLLHNGKSQHNKKQS